MLDFSKAAAECSLWTWAVSSSVFLCLLCDEGSVKRVVHIPSLGVWEQEDTSHPWWNK